jgi:hypothetical protein
MIRYGETPVKQRMPMLNSTHVGVRYTALLPCAAVSVRSSPEAFRAYHRDSVRKRRAAKAMSEPDGATIPWLAASK